MATVTARETAKRAGIVTLGTLLSRVLGLLRDMVIAASFSLGVTDAFFVAFTIPNALRGLLAEGAVSGAFIPVHAEVRETQGPEAARLFYGRFLGSLGVVLLAVTAFGIAFAPWLVELYAGGFDEDRLALTVSLTRWMFPYIALMGVAALAGGALNAAHRFAAPAFSPALLNVALVGSALLAAPIAAAFQRPAVFALAIGVLVGGVLQMLAQFPALRSEGLFAAPRVAFGDPGVRKAFRLMVPLLAGLGVYQLNVLLSRRFASGLPEGAQSYLYYAQRLTELPQGLFAFAIATATLPTLSALRAKQDHDGVARTFTDGLRLSMFVAIPSTVFLIVAAEPTVQVLFGRGNFSPEAVHQTAVATLCMAPTIWAVSAVRTSIPLFYASNDTRSPVIASVANLVVFIAASLALLGPFAHAGIAAANSLASMAQLAVLAWRGQRHLAGRSTRGIGVSLLRTTAASFALGAVFHASQFGFARFAPGAPAVLGLLVSAAFSGMAFVGAAHALGSTEVRSVAAAIRRRATKGAP